MLGSSRIVAFLLAADPARARNFYETTLGLPFLRDDGFAQVFDANGIEVRVTPMPNHSASEHPVLGWTVGDIARTVSGLAAAGVQFEKYPFLEQDDLGIWTSPDGSAKVAFFKDPDGNLLSLTEQVG
jgi:catechol 2,3-dioxygenase-like lactoylglutathione lyase family enzyme